MTDSPTPRASFGDTPPVGFDWAAHQPQKQRKNGADYYSGTVLCYSQDDFDALWALRVVVNVRPVGEGVDAVYIDSWRDPSIIQHTLSMSLGTELHMAILTDLTMDERMWRDPGTPVVAVVQAKAEFLLLS